MPIEPATHFASDYSQFSVPLGGTAERGFWALAGSPDDLGDDAWSVLDIDGDGLADLVRTASLISNGGETPNSTNK